MLEEGIWERKDLKGSELYHKTLGIIGFGRIGALVTKRMHAFDMRVIAYDPYPLIPVFSALVWKNVRPWMIC